MKITLATLLVFASAIAAVPSPEPHHDWNGQCKPKTRTVTKTTWKGKTTSTRYKTVYRTTTKNWCKNDRWRHTVTKTRTQTLTKVTTTVSSVTNTIPTTLTSTLDPLIVSITSTAPAETITLTSTAISTPDAVTITSTSSALPKTVTLTVVSTPSPITVTVTASPEPEPTPTGPAVTFTNGGFEDPAASAWTSRAIQGPVVTDSRFITGYSSATGVKSGRNAYRLCAAVDPEPYTITEVAQPFTYAVPGRAHKFSVWAKHRATSSQTQKCTLKVFSDGKEILASGNLVNDFTLLEAEFVPGKGVEVMAIQAHCSVQGEQGNFKVVVVDDVAVELVAQ
ncbi:hypothetical protein BJ508DRAFT_379783 [Ascobolus immersus RN42]|uniref:CBM-cenC domain-containing protein n=1 Tax=Ascobolus immersus RN42 TaxID=1160509 RepID=A0A3N4HPW7_ASCIM|nr:hypothetical protein BJ508DRAFT_379783 [Ascobolus immersus RN42]